MSHTPLVGLFGWVGRSVGRSHGQSVKRCMELNSSSSEKSSIELARSLPDYPKSHTQRQHEYAYLCDHMMVTENEAQNREDGSYHRWWHITTTSSATRIKIASWQLSVSVLDDTCRNNNVTLSLTTSFRRDDYVNNNTSCIRWNGWSWMPVLWWRWLIWHK